jgi:glyoxylate reductase
MHKPIIAVRPPLADMFAPLLGSLDAEVVSAEDALPEGTVVLLQSAMHPLNAAAVDAAPASLGLIANLGVGYDNIDLKAAAGRGIAVSNTPVVTEDTADLTFALLLAAARRLSICERLLRDNAWAAAQGRLGVRVHGKTLGIVGFGAIGQAVARRARGFGMTVLYYGPRRKESVEATLQASYCPDLDTLLRQSDFVSLHCPLSDASRYLINAQTLALLKPSAILINTGRGPLIDEAALVDALQAGKFAGAGLDVFEYEPEVNEGLKALDNVTLLPHIGSATGECRRDIAMRGIANIEAFIRDGKPLDPVQC